MALEGPLKKMGLRAAAPLESEDPAFEVLVLLEVVHCGVPHLQAVHLALRS
jgi:hypothetical protein